jgi:hypothetical protein
MPPHLRDRTCVLSRPRSLVQCFWFLVHYRLEPTQKLKRQELGTWKRTSAIKFQLTTGWLPYPVFTSLLNLKPLNDFARCAGTHVQTKNRRESTHERSDCASRASLSPALLLIRAGLKSKTHSVLTYVGVRPSGEAPNPPLN